MTKEKINVGLLGCGTVGSGVYKILTDNQTSIKNKAGAKIEVKKVAVKDLSEELAVEVAEEKLTTDANEVLTDDEIDVVVEVIGGVNPAKEFVLTAIENAKSVVTANKELMSKEGHEILMLAEDKGVDVFFEASVGGGIPIIAPLKENLAGNKLNKIMGIVNGTTNYILTKMEQEGSEFDDVLEKAQELGYAEADPTSDVEGYDAAYKLAILASIAFESQVEVDDIHIEGIRKITKDDIKYANELGYKIKLLAIGKDNGRIEVRVHPTLIPNNHPLANVNDVFNAIFVEGDAIDEVMFYGPGAGQMPTGSAVVGDIIAASRNILQESQTRIPCTCFTDKEVKSESEVECSFYLRLEVMDQPGVLGQITGLLGGHNVSIASVIQKEHTKDLVPLVLVTHNVKEGNLISALEEIENLDGVNNIGNLIRVEEYQG